MICLKYVCTKNHCYEDAIAERGNRISKDEFSRIDVSSALNMQDWQQKCN